MDLFSVNRVGGRKGIVYSNPKNDSKNTLPKTNSSHLKIGLPKRKRSYSNHPFSGANC